MAAESGYDLARWTRKGIIAYAWTPFETFEKLAYSKGIREELTRMTEGFAAARETFHSLKLPWRIGACFYGAPGTGKSAATRALARSLGWQHLTIPASEILDANFLERAVAEAVSAPERVVVLEDVDRMISRMEPEEFFAILDYALERAEACVWVATSRHPERMPKTQLVRPGRFERMVRFDLPSEEARRSLLVEIFERYYSSENPAGAEAGERQAIDEPTLASLVDRTERMSYAHFEELRRVAARTWMEGSELEFLRRVEEYVDDQLISGDRSGGIADSTAHMSERLDQVDPRTLTAALDMTDVLRRVMKKVIADAFEEAQQRQGAGERATRS